MSDWKCYQLKNLGVIKTGKTPPSSCKDAFSNTGVPFVTPKDMNGVKTIFKTERYLSKIGLDLVKNYLVPKNSIAVSCIGSDMGKAYLLSEDSVTNQQINTLIVNKNHNFEFIYYKLSIMQDYLKSIAGGSATPILNKSHFSEIEIELPDLDTQNNFVEKLKYLDKKIQLNTQINQTLEQIAQALFKSWFVDFDPVRAKVQALSDGLSLEQAELAAMQAISGKTPEELTALSQTQPERYAELAETAKAFPCEMVEVDGVEAPKGWETIPFKDFIKEKKEKVGSLKNTPEYSVTNNGIIPRSQKFNKQLSKNPEKNKLLHKTDLVFGMSREILNWGIMVDDIGSVSSAYHVYSIDKNVINHLYLKMMMMNKFQYFNELIRPSSREGQSFDKELLKEKTVIVPSNFLLDHFLYKLELLNHQINTIKKETKTLISIRDTLLPELLNGKI